MGQLRPVLPARFAAVSRFSRQDVLQMVSCLDALLGMGPRAWRFETRQLCLEARSRLCESLASSPAMVKMPTTRLLDAAAGLLYASEQLHGDGEAIAAFAIEGLQGRLMEAAVGSGRLEDDPAVCRWGAS